MVIGGKKIERNQNSKELDDHYFQAIKSIVRETLSELNFVQFVSYKRSKSTDSMYFKFKMNHHEQVFKLSLRTHLPKAYEDNQFYIYLYEYDHLPELKIEIQEQLISFYNKRANELVIIKNPISYKRTKHNHRTRRKRRINQRKVDSLYFNEPFHQLMNEINNRNQLDKEMSESNMKPQIKCPFCRNDAIVTYEENRMYKSSCARCKEIIIIQSTSEVDAIEKFNSIRIG